MLQRDQYMGHWRFQNQPWVSGQERERKRFKPCLEHVHDFELLNDLTRSNWRRVEAGDQMQQSTTREVAPSTVLRARLCRRVGTRSWRNLAHGSAWLAVEAETLSVDRSATANELNFGGLGKNSCLDTLQGMTREESRNWKWYTFFRQKVRASID